MILIIRLYVNEALSLLQENLPRFSETDLFILPPDSVFFNTDNDDEDEPQSMYHLSSRQLFVPTKIVFCTVYQETKIFKSENDVRVLKTKSSPSKESNSG